MKIQLELESLLNLHAQKFQNFVKNNKIITSRRVCYVTQWNEFNGCEVNYFGAVSEPFELTQTVFEVHGLTTDLAEVKPIWDFMTQEAFEASSTVLNLLGSYVVDTIEELLYDHGFDGSNIILTDFKVLTDDFIRVSFLCKREGDIGRVYSFHIRRVLAGLCAHISMFNNSGTTTLTSVTLNEEFYEYWKENLTSMQVVEIPF